MADPADLRLSLHRLPGNFENVQHRNMLKICVADTSCNNKPTSGREQLND